MLIGLMGKKRAGKDTFARRLVERHGFVRYAFADALKDVLFTLNPLAAVVDGEPVHLSTIVMHSGGWERAKDEYQEVRRLLQDLGVAVRKHVGKDTWLDPVMRQVAKESRPVVITDVRFWNEAAAIADAGGYLVRVVRPGHDDGDTHESETDLDDWEEDFTAHNIKDVEWLESEADMIVALIRSEH